ncbi:MAG TPA: trypsin-like peptidase domain-containing protein [Candidatus Nanoarchaeia archaeon]|nr:trypsin-like peptidase domain-containing protein [Candidatus Nanoarchaeia archaeon]
MAIQYHRNQQVVHHVPLKRHHKIIIGGFTGIVIIYMVVTAILLNGLIVKQTLNHNSLKDEISEVQADTSNKINQLTEVLEETQSSLTETKKTLLSINETVKSELSNLKASVGEDFSGIIENSVRSVVTVRTDVGQGTGFIISNDGYIVTNAHVLAGGRKLYVLTYDEEAINAEFIGYNAELDIALLKIEGEYERLRLANSDNIQVGEKVIAIGNPLGLQFSVSEGIVSGVHRKGSNGLNIYIQTDAALNPGNSGGPLINKEGRVVGINNFKIGGGENLGFALESNYIKDAANEISMEELGIELL